MKNANEFEWEFEAELENGEPAILFTTALYVYDYDAGCEFCPADESITIIGYDGPEPDAAEEEKIIEAISRQEAEMREEGQYY